VTRVIEFGPGCPERGWRPLIDWLAEQGVDADTVSTMVVDVDAMVCAARVFVTVAGVKQLDGEGNLLREDRQFPIKSLPPTKDGRGPEEAG